MKDRQEPFLWEKISGIFTKPCIECNKVDRHSGRQWKERCGQSSLSRHNTVRTQACTLETSACLLGACHELDCSKGISFIVSELCDQLWDAQHMHLNNSLVQKWVGGISYEHLLGGQCMEQPHPWPCKMAVNIAPFWKHYWYRGYNILSVETLRKTDKATNTRDAIWDLPWPAMTWVFSFMEDVITSPFFLLA